MIPRLKKQYRNVLIDDLKKQLNINNTNEVPNLEKIVKKIGDGKAENESRALESIDDE